MVVGAPDFEAWYRAEHPALLPSLTLMSGAPDLAREVVDEALVRALERWDRVGSMASPGGWTYGVAVNCLRRHQRRSLLERRFHRQEEGMVEPVEPTGELWTLVRVRAQGPSVREVEPHRARIGFRAQRSEQGVRRLPQPNSGRSCQRSVVISSDVTFTTTHVGSVPETVSRSDEVSPSEPASTRSSPGG